MSMNDQESDNTGEDDALAASDHQQQQQQQTSESYTSWLRGRGGGQVANTLASLHEDHLLAQTRAQQQQQQIALRNLLGLPMLRSPPSHDAAANASSSTSSGNEMYQLLLAGQATAAGAAAGAAAVGSGRLLPRDITSIEGATGASNRNPDAQSFLASAFSAPGSLQSRHGAQLYPMSSSTLTTRGVLPLFQEEVAQYQQQQMPSLQQQLLGLSGGFPSLRPQNADLFLARSQQQQNLLMDPSIDRSTLLGLPANHLDYQTSLRQGDHALLEQLLSRTATQDQQQQRLQEDYVHELLLQAEWLNRQQQHQRQQLAEQQILASQRLNHNMLPEAYIRALQRQQHDPAGDASGLWSSIVAERVRASAGHSQNTLQADPLLQRNADAFMANPARSLDLSALADRVLLGNIDAGSTQPMTTYASLPFAADTTTAAQSMVAALGGPTHQSRELGHDDRKPAAVPLRASAEAATAAAALPKEDSPHIEQPKKKKKRTTSPPQDQHEEEEEEKDEEFEAFLRTLPDLSRLRRDYDHEAFPVKLHRMLLEVEKKGLSHIVSWTDSGKAFRVHLPTLFEKEIGPTYFRHQQYASFRRLCSTYGFQRLRTVGLDDGAFGHALFRRNRPDLLHMIHRVTELTEEQKSILWPNGGPTTRKRKKGK